MELLSFDFLFFTIVSIAIYYLLPRKYQNVFLLVVSYYFYFSWGWKFAAALASITIFNYFFAKWILTINNKGERKAPVWLGVIINLGVFGILLLQGFFNEPLANFLEGIGASGISIRLLLPIGFSYYVLESISYVVDVSRKQVKIKHSLLDFGLYLAYFPKLLAGPIERAQPFLTQLREDKVVDNEILSRSFGLIFIGLLRSLVFAEALIILMPSDVFIDPLSYPNIELVIWIITFGLVIYNQFAGYTNVVRGVSGIFGIELTQNFAQPLFSEKFSEFWTRWHISLSQWLRDYIYLPLSRYFLRRNPSRKNIANRIIPPMVTMLASGLWHGATLNLILWGAISGFYMVAEQILSMFKKLSPSTVKPAWRRAVSMISVIGLGVVASIPFRLDLLASKLYLYGIIKADNWELPPFSPFIILAIPIWFDYLQYRDGEELVYLKWSKWVQSFMIAVLILLIFIVDNLQSTYLPFTYP